MIPAGHRFLTAKKDLRQWSHQRSFGAIAPPQLPKTLGRKPLAIYDQLITNFCTAFAYAAAASFRNNFAVSPEYQVAQEGKIALAPIMDGATLDTMCQAGFAIGIVADSACPIKLASSTPEKVADWTVYPKALDDKATPQGWFYTAHDGKYDAFDNMRSAIYSEWLNGRTAAVILATPWYREFNAAGATDTAAPIPKTASIADHAYVMFDWDGDDALCQLSSGKNFGKDGVLRVPRETINFLFANPVSDSRIIEDRHVSEGSLKGRILSLLLNSYVKLLTLLLLRPKASPQPQNQPQSDVPAQETVSPTVPENEAPKPDILATFCTAIRDYEGLPGDLNYRNNNPGNFRCSPVGYAPMYGTVQCVGGFARFTSYELGWKYLENSVLYRVKAHPTWTLLDFFENYAPAADGNYPEHYAAFVAMRCDCSVDTKLAALFA